MKNEITLDKEALKVLASDTRIDILKKLDLRRMTITELSSSLNLSKATVHEHLTKLIDAGLVKKGDSHSNRVYYELTGNSIGILHPHERTKIMFLLSSAISAFIGGFIEMYKFVRASVPTT